jgi:hypothetical protein
MKAGTTLGLVGLLAASSLAMGGCCWLDSDDPSCVCPFGESRSCPPDAGVDAGTCRDPQSSGTVALNFTIDATARPGVYANEDLEWKGAFVFNRTTHVLTYDGSWSGPYAGVWDDGPWDTSGGHEPKGSVAGDNKFGITAFMTIPTSDLTFEYGAQTKEGGWIWPPIPNGSVTIPANCATEITAGGLTLPAGGTTDLKLMLDTGNLGTEFTFVPGQSITVKGQMSHWLEDPAYDDGTHGDAQAGDHIFTYTLSLNDVARIKPASGTYVEFVWMIDGVEYKTAGGACELTGVSGQTNPGTGWVAATIDLAPNNNTRVAIP